MAEGPLGPTPGQTVGPFFGFALPYEGGPDLVPEGHPAAVRLTGRVFDGEGEPVPDALLEIWQADADGQPCPRPGSWHRNGTFTGWGRAATDAQGRYFFRTLVPGAVEGRPAVIAMTVFARGLLDRLFTRVYLPGDGLGSDPLLAALPADRRATLIAARDVDGYVFDVVLQGSAGRPETVFLAYRDRA